MTHLHPHGSTHEHDEARDHGGHGGQGHDHEHPVVADGLHARTDGFTSLAVLLGVGGVALGLPWADPAVGLLTTVAILGVLRSAVKQVGHG